MKAVPRSRRQVYKMRPIINAVVDKGSFFEMGSNFGRSVIAGLARLEGRAVLVLASDPFHYGGSWTAEVAKIDHQNDLAVLRVNGHPAGAAPLWQNSHGPLAQQGDQVLLAQRDAL